MSSVNSIESNRHDIETDEKKLREFYIGVVGKVK